MLDREHVHDAQHAERRARSVGAPTGPGAAARVLSLQRAAGNVAVATLLSGRGVPQAIRRAITITKVDFNPDVAAQLEQFNQPVDDAFKNFEIRAQDLQAMKDVLLPWLAPDNPVAYPEGNQPIPDRRKRQEIHMRLRALTVATNLSGADVPALARALVTHLEA